MNFFKAMLLAMSLDTLPPIAESSRVGGSVLIDPLGSLEFPCRCGNCSQIRLERVLSRKERKARRRRRMRIKKSRGWF